MHRENSGQGIKLALLREQRPVLRRPPIAREKSRHDTIPAAAVPDKNSARLENAREFPDHATVVRWMREEAKGRKEIQYGIESAIPARGHFSHVTTRVAKVWTGTAFPRNGEELTGVIQAIHVESRLGEQVRVPSLPTRYVENTRRHGQPEQFHEARRFLTIALGRKQEPVFQEIMGIEG
jgi:hypothetical protein